MSLKAKNLEFTLREEGDWTGRRLLPAAVFFRSLVSKLSGPKITQGLIVQVASNGQSSLKDDWEIRMRI